MKVVLDARLQSGIPGGIEQVILGLASGLSRMPEDGDRYDFLVVEDEWLRDFVEAPARVVVVPPDPRSVLSRLGGRARQVGRLFSKDAADMLVNDPILERSGADVVHLLRQNAPGTTIPYIYHPYDLQHMHLPEFFTESERSDRDRLYRGHCRAATFVIMMTQWAKDDLCEKLQVPRPKVAVVPLPPFLRLLLDVDVSGVDEVRATYQLPAEFALYPAQTWPHKNHLMLLQALALLRDQAGVVVPLVCCGTTNSFFDEIQRVVRDLNLGDQVRFLGWVDSQTLHALYLSARCLVFPSRFEGWGMPITEAFEMQLPVACSDAPWLPDIVHGDAALLFDPMDPVSIADAIRTVWSDEEVRTDLVAQGSKRVKALSWTSVTETFTAMYRSVSSRPLSTSDEERLTTAGLG